jgi:membrane-associated phospholipid phosphatase
VLLAAGLLVGFSRLYLGVHYLSDVLEAWKQGSVRLTCALLDRRGNPSDAITHTLQKAK